MPVSALINKEVIPFICHGKKVTIEYLLAITGFPKDKVIRWLDVADRTLPTINQAKLIAKCLHIPFAALYMNTADINIKSLPTIKNYRTIDGCVVVDDSSLNIAVCDVLQERDFLMEQNAELGIELPDFSISPIHSAEPMEWARQIREDFSIDLRTQYVCKSTRQFYIYLREKLEAKGVFVQCFTDVPVEVARGFSLFEQKLPVIGINNDDRHPAKSFTLIHELVHLLKRESTVCNAMYNTISLRSEEVFCNAVAGELLVPREALESFLGSEHFTRPYSMETIKAIAKRFSVSREVIIRRLLDCDKINETEYNAYSENLRVEFEQERERIKLEKQAGIVRTIPRNISRDTIDRISSAVAKTLYYGYGEEIYSKRDIALHLGIAQKHVDKFLLEVSRWNS